MSANGSTITATKSYRTWLSDSSRWQEYRPRIGDVVVATYPKSGTTWMQRILSLLILKENAPVALDSVFPWWELSKNPLATVVAEFEGQHHRRAIKTHLPFDGIPYFDDVKYIHVARDGRDVALSYHNHTMGFSAEALAWMDAAGMADPALGRRYPRVNPDPSAYFHDWLTTGALDGEEDGTPYLSYFNYERTFWEARERPNILFVHYSDMQRDLGGEVRRVAEFLGITVTAAELRMIVESASFASMRRDTSRLLPNAGRMFASGVASPLVNKGGSGRWRGVYAPSDVRLFWEKLYGAVPARYAEWLVHGSAS